MSNQKSLTANVLSSSTLLFIARFFQKSIGIISLIILSRILDEHDYAVIAICTFVLYLAETLSTLGSESFIVRKTKVTDDDLNTAFSLDLFAKIGIWLIIVASIPIITMFLDDYQDIGVALFVSSLVLFVNAFKNPGIYLLNRDFNYKGIFVLQLVQKILAFVITISIAIIYESYWALIIGDLTFAIIYLIGSYLVSPYKPKISFVGMSIQWNFSKWIIVSSAIGYLRAQLDTLVVSKIYPPNILGQYHLIKQVSVLPATDVIGPALLPLMTSFAKVKDGAANIAYQFSLSLYVTILLIAPLSIYMWQHADLIIDVMLGDKWISAAPLMSILAAMLFSYAINQLISPIFVVKKKVKELFIYNLTSFVFVVSALAYLLLAELSIEDFTFYRTLAAFIPVFFCLLYVFHFLSIKNIKILALNSPIFLAALLSIFAVSYIPTTLFSFSLFNLIYHFATYCLLYLLLMWLFSNKQAKHHYEVVHIKQLVGKLINKVWKK